jgi:hypothetical protein
MFSTPVRFLRAGVATLAISLATGPAAFAGNIYATNLGQSSNRLDYSDGDTVTLSYLLNDNSTGVTVDVLDSSNVVVKSINAGAQLKGNNNVVWDGTDNSSTIVPIGDYSFRVNSTGAAGGAWTQFNSTAQELNYFFTPRGVAVNNNPNSPYYGRIYVAEGRGGITGPDGPTNRVTADGMYMLNADISAGGIAGGTGAHTAGVSWRLFTDVPSDGTPSSPFRLQVGPDDSVYIADFSDAHSGLWQANPNLTSAVEVLDSTGRLASGLNGTHGSLSDVIVTGTGASRTIYTADEDFIPAGGSTGSVLRYDIGETATFVGAPSGTRYMDGAGTLATGNRIQNLENSIAFDNAGNLWMSQVRSGGAADLLSSLIQVSPAGTVLWESVPNLAANSLADPLRNTRGIAYDPVNNLLALVTSQATGLIQIFDPVSKTILATFPFGSTTNTDVAFDAVGNLYVTNRSAERLRLWSPPNGLVSGRNYVANAFSTNSLGPLGTIRVAPEPASAMLFVLGLLGWFGCARRR